MTQKHETLLLLNPPPHQNSTAPPPNHVIFCFLQAKSGTIDKIAGGGGGKKKKEKKPKVCEGGELPPGYFWKLKIIYIYIYIYTTEVEAEIGEMCEVICVLCVRSTKEANGMGFARTAFFFFFLLQASRSPSRNFAKKKERGDKFKYNWILVFG